MRAGPEKALARVINSFGEPRPHCAYVFANKRANRMKVLVCDGFGLWLAARLFTILHEPSYGRISKMRKTLHSWLSYCMIAALVLVPQSVIGDDEQTVSFSEAADMILESAWYDAVALEMLSDRGNEEPVKDWLAASITRKLMLASYFGVRKTSVSLRSQEFLCSLTESNDMRSRVEDALQDNLTLTQILDRFPSVQDNLSKAQRTFGGAGCSAANPSGRLHE